MSRLRHTVERLASKPRFYWYRLRYILAGVRILWPAWPLIDAWRAVAGDFDGAPDTAYDLSMSPADSVRESMSYWSE